MKVPIARRGLGPSFRAIGLAQLGCVLLAPVVPEAASGQVLQASTSDSSWIVVSSAHVDLWYHGLAILGLENDSALPQYDPDYALTVTEEKRRRGVFPTRLDEIGAGLTSDFDQWFPDDIIHFVPLYFPTADMAGVFRSLQNVAAGRSYAPRGASVRRGYSIMSHLLHSDGARGALSRFAGALTYEWNVFYEEYWEEALPERQTQIQAVQAVWDQQFASKLQSFLDANDVRRGILMLSPSVGFEGRIVVNESVPAASVVAILDPPHGAESSAFLFLKELCYLTVDRLARTTIDLTGDSAASTRRNLAVRCGDTIVERLLPELTDAYRDLFALPFVADTVAHLSFQELYPVDEDMLTRLTADLSEQWN